MHFVSNPTATTPLYELDRDALARDGREREWLLTNGLGGYAGGSCLGLNTRRYHGLLIAAMRAPVERVMCLSAIADEAIVDVGAAGETTHRMTLFEFAGGDRSAERGAAHAELERFGVTAAGARWTYRFSHPQGDVTIDKLVHLYDRRNAVGVRYTVRGPGVPIRLKLRPLARLTDVHDLGPQHDHPRFETRALPNGCVLTNGAIGLHVMAADAIFRRDQQWWKGVHHGWEARRGQDTLEDLASPGVFEWTTVPTPLGASRLELNASVDAREIGDIEGSTAARERRLGQVIRGAIASAGDTELAGQDQQRIAELARASDAFVVERVLPAESDGAFGESVIAGYPWFADWGRDTMICLPGLLLETQRHAEARRVLETFAANRRDGLIPNRFDDHTGEAYYNTVDASLWYLHAACAYAEAANDAAVFAGQVGAACRDVVEAYRRGTKFDIKLDGADGLIAAGSAETQLTWMDAQRGGVTFTPRHGKCVEINALWIHGLAGLSKAFAEIDAAYSAELAQWAGQSATGFKDRFWDSERSCLFDRLEPINQGAEAGDWRPTREIRPNQVIAASLELAPLTQEQRAGVVAIARRELLTPRGLRTLAPSDPAYRGRFEGDLMQRDEAYHNGTVWPWLIGPFVEASLRAAREPGSAATQARADIAGVLEGLTHGTLGQIAEVYGGDMPGAPDGCFAQAWSLAEALRSLALICRVERGGRL